MSGPMIELRAVHHGAQALSVKRHEWVGRAYQGPLYACGCGVSREAWFALALVDAPPVLVIDFEGGTAVDLPIRSSWERDRPTR
jgi:hypothetical protein